MMMKDQAHRVRRTPLRRGILTAVLTLTLGTTTTAQTPVRWSPASTAPVALPVASIATAPQAAPVALPLPASIATPPHSAKTLPHGFDVRLFEAMAQQIVANQRVPGLAMAIVHNGEVLSARGSGLN